MVVKIDLEPRERRIRRIDRLVEGTTLIPIMDDIKSRQHSLLLI
jgi:hypothetical protein